jgi:hypothetical protein
MSMRRATVFFVDTKNLCMGQEEVDIEWTGMCYQIPTGCLGALKDSKHKVNNVCYESIDEAHEAVVKFLLKRDRALIREHRRIKKAITTYCGSYKPGMKA